MSGKKGRSGRKPLSGRKMTNNELQARHRMKKKAAEMEIQRVEDMEKYNVFGPEVEARQFIEYLVAADGNLVKALKQWKPSLKSRSLEDVYRYGEKMIERSRIKELIREELNKGGATVSKIVSDIYDISQREDTQNKDKLRALELLGKFKKMFDTEEGKGNVYNLNIDESTAKRLLRRRGEVTDVTDDSSADGCYVIDGAEESDRLCNSDAGQL